MKKLGLFCIFVFLSACSKPEIYEHIEANSIETMDESEGPIITYVPSGYMNSNSITYTQEWRDKRKVKVSAIEDYYDTNGNYIKTIVFHSNGAYKKFHNQYSGDKEEKELYEPATILLPAEFKQTPLLELTEEEKVRVKEHVQAHIEQLK